MSSFIIKQFCTANQRVLHDYWPIGSLSIPSPYTVIRFLWVKAKFGTWTVVSVNETLVEDKMREFKGECAHFSFNKCPIYTHDGASAKFSINSQETDNSVPSKIIVTVKKVPKLYTLNRVNIASWPMIVAANMQQHPPYLKYYSTFLRFSLC